MWKYSQHLYYLACLVTELLRSQGLRMILNNVLVVLLPTIVLGKFDAGNKSRIHNAKVQIYLESATS